MLIVSNLAKRYPGAASYLFRDVSFVVNGGERLGIVGANGSGKTTLLRCIAGELAPDTGSTRTAPGVRVGYLAQGLAPDETASVYDVLFPLAAALHDAEIELAHLGEALAKGSAADTPTADAYADALDRLTTLSQFIDPAAGEKALSELGLDVSLDWPVSALSGGQKTRLMLARTLVSRPQLLLLDEPTNHLDAQALDWLEDWLRHYDGAALIVSHDRVFLDNIATHILALGDDASARHLTGSYSDYLATLEREHAQQMSQWRDEQVEIGRMKADIRRIRDRANHTENTTTHFHYRSRAKQFARKAASLETRLERFVDSADRAEKPGLNWQVKLDFDQLPRAYGEVVTLDAVSIGYDRPLVEDIRAVIQGGDRIALMGANGSGKTTLIRTILGEQPPLAGHIRLSPSIQTGYLAQEQEALDPQATPLSSVQAAVRMSETDARSFLHHFLFSGDDPLRPNHLLSYGERARLMLALLVARGCNLLVLDEPLNHLDLPSREQFEVALQQYPGALLLVSHDRWFRDHVATHVWTLDNGRFKVDYVT